VIGSLPSVVMVPYDSVALALHDVLWNKVDGAALGLLSAALYCRNLYSDRLHIATPPLTDDALRMAVRRDSDLGELVLKDFEQALGNLRGAGVYDQLVAKWGLSQPSPQGGIACRAVAGP
jgi:ABC-type amino acid transport substrate-binding protein